MHKIAAYLLMFFGLVFMFVAFTGMYQTFVHKKPVVQVVQTQPLVLNTQYGAVQLDTTFINQLLNLALFAIFMIFVASLGGKLVSAGNQLLKTERICEMLQKLRREDVLDYETDIRKL